MRLDDEIASGSPYLCKEMPLTNAEGFKLIYSLNDQVVAGSTRTRVVDFTLFPPDVATLLESSSNSGVPTFASSIFVDRNHQGKGLGTAIWKSAMRRLVGQYPTVIVSDTDDSVSLTSHSPIGWTERRVPEIQNYMHELGYRSELLYKGLVDNKPTWVIKYSPTSEKS